MTQKIRDTIERYVELVGSGPTQGIVDLYTEDATVEDPIGTPLRRGHEAIREFYSVFESLDRSTELRTDTVRIAGNHAAFMFDVVTVHGDQRFTVTPIDVMEFDEDARIVRMRAYWNPEQDMRAEPA
ncbi:delta(5)-3-ketosteroid isomerase [Nocardia farcinica]|uniref:nuclear transport factor 2 family protein n=1 Tax=Nocardia farcinica TaxID=37329 RepID=UPI000DF88FD1|nr:nuclear transport factor 2 family protein [Nocardia farcinica]SUE30183.1 delta(5)-3-ketosteroid isomerase [Nocardia farcinica]